MYSDGFCQIISGQTVPAAVVLPIKECVIPGHVSGQFFVYRESFAFRGLFTGPSTCS